MSAVASAAIMSELMASAPPKRAETLARLKTACDDLCNDGRFRLRDIERQIEFRFGKQFGPRAQTISNEKSLPLGMYHYVEARRREADDIALRRHTASRPQRRLNIAQRIESIVDIDTRNLMRDLYDRLLVAEAKCTRASFLLKTSGPGIDIDKIIAGEKVITQNFLSVDEIETVRQLRLILSNEDKLSLCGLTLDRGQIRRKGRLGDELISATLLEKFFAVCVHLDGL